MKHYRYYLRNEDYRYNPSKAEEPRIKYALENLRGRILDLGCEDNALFFCPRFGVKYHGVELNRHVLRLVRGRERDANLVQASAEYIPFADGSFDSVFCGELLEHIANPGLLLQEVRRVLADDGFAILTTPIRLPNFMPSQHHLREYLPHELWVLLEKQGFKILEYQIMEVYRKEGVPRLTSVVKLSRC